MMSHLIDLLPQASVPLALAFSVIALVLLLLIAAAILDDAADMRQAAELRRLTAALPPEWVPGRHRPEVAWGTRTQILRDDPTMPIEVAR